MTNAVRTIYLPTFTLSQLRRAVHDGRDAALKALHHDPMILFERKGQDPVIRDNPFRGVPMDDVVEALGFDWKLRPLEEEDPRALSRRRPAGAACSIRITDQEPRA